MPISVALVELWSKYTVGALDLDHSMGAKVKNEDVLRITDEDYSSYISNTNIKKKLKPLNKAIDDMLARLCEEQTPEHQHGPVMELFKSEDYFQAKDTGE
ncbi:hypothetical protein HUJ04_008507 [Dendroctonus ponderosae]|nr:hypothetical protein HUJ04_008507 [Dendroctonus ponderosae]KAH1008413.1 hypothetical protein HUJ05_008968 [Dendroctonus ponderosae]